uniref:N-acetyltransferase domain-containing protein n=1 Tax=Corethron hystrix TaxID=216773 RepID=A0A7S1BY18_9STRA|mmetsp:Transcript_6381/g.13792  ORF Transcript_6381/g.13792 Transcript_6381/m.13792 type:complete len:381 (+) Transcript_6381:147-1289(+)
MLRMLKHTFRLGLFSTAITLCSHAYVTPPSYRITGIPAPVRSRRTISSPYSPTASSRLLSQQRLEIETKIDDEKITKLFAWISRAFAGEEEYNNLMAAVAAIFATNLPPESPLNNMLGYAMSNIAPEETQVGSPLPRFERERASLGAMGAAQWTGQFRTRPHSLLDVRGLSSVEDWKLSLPRGCRRTLSGKVDKMDFYVTARPIRGGEPAPHSSLAHFRCVVEHEMRLIAAGGNDPDGFLEALSEGVGRYAGTTRMAGTIREDRIGSPKGKVIAFAHEVVKGRTIRGQWFYSTDEASKCYVWFHSVQDLVRRAIEMENIDIVDLGPSGSDAFSELKERYGFKAVDDWPAVADYMGPFVYEEGQESDTIGGIQSKIFESLM